MSNSRRVNKQNKRTGVESISPLYRKVISKSFQNEMASNDPESRKMQNRLVFYYLEKLASGKRSRDKHSKESLMTFVSRLKDFIGIDFINKRTNEPIAIVGFSQGEVDLIKELYSCIERNGDPSEFMASLANRNDLSALLARDDVESCFFSDDSSARDSSSPGSLGDPEGDRSAE